MVDKCKTINSPGVTNGLKNRKSIDSQTWEEILGNCGSGVEALPLQPNSDHEVLDQILESCSFTMQDFASLQGSMVKSQVYTILMESSSISAFLFLGCAAECFLCIL